jgi:hypothetical protein
MICLPRVDKPLYILGLESQETTNPQRLDGKRPTGKLIPDTAGSDLKNLCQFFQC